MKIEFKKYRVHGYDMEIFCDNLESAKDAAKLIADLGTQKYEFSQFVFIDKLDYTPEGSYHKDQGYTPY